MHLARISSKRNLLDFYARRGNAPKKSSPEINMPSRKTMKRFFNIHLCNLCAFIGKSSRREAREGNTPKDTHKTVQDNAAIYHYA
jgi:hypothetical protein